MTTLAEQLKELNERGRTRIDDAKLAVMDAATAAIDASGLVDKTLAPGAVVDDFALPDATGRSVRLSELLAKGPVVLAFYRGGWCPYCSLELRTLQGVVGEFASRGATLVAVSPQTPDASLSTTEKLALAFPVLSDVGNVVARSFGLVFTLPQALREVYDGFGIDLPGANGEASFELPVPATYIIGTDRRVVWRFAHPDYTRRAEPADVLAALDRLHGASA